MSAANRLPSRSLVIGEVWPASAANVTIQRFPNPGMTAEEVQQRIQFNWTSLRAPRGLRHAKYSHRRGFKRGDL